MLQKSLTTTLCFQHCYFTLMFHSTFLLQQFHPHNPTTGFFHFSDEKSLTAVSRKQFFSEGCLHSDFNSSFIQSIRFSNLDVSTQFLVSRLNWKITFLFGNLSKTGFKEKPLKWAFLSNSYFTFDIKTTHSTWLDRSGLMSVIGAPFRLIWFVPKYLRLLVETYQQIL